MQSRSSDSPQIQVQSDLVHETVFNAKVSGKDLDDLIVSGVMRQIGRPVMDRTGVTWKVVHRNETTATEGTRQIAEVTIVVDHRTDAVLDTSTVHVRPGDVVLLPPGHHWLDITSMDGWCGYVAVPNDA
ncbi:hypothetical protein GCM10007242_44580 [Pigmentiphaga litoralis]|uniref:hypothetical protein n=1 Tax=Pigmentiphaga litoralis TaxID=516702 RepID=UPI0016772A87|nr:hypothetical protein [Pigmentiphaga litoralis]GGX32720.1 hypothetical protein GCM10007242_44580 [Pigmentiphaga litoralis]